MSAPWEPLPYLDGLDRETIEADIRRASAYPDSSVSLRWLSECARSLLATREQLRSNYRHQAAHTKRLIDETRSLEQRLRSTSETVRVLLVDKQRLERRLRKHSRMTKVRWWSPSWGEGRYGRSYAQTIWYGPGQRRHAVARAHQLRSDGYEVELLWAPLGSLEEMPDDE